MFKCRGIYGSSVYNKSTKTVAKPKEIVCKSISCVNKKNEFNNETRIIIDIEIISTVYNFNPTKCGSVWTEIIPALKFSVTANHKLTNRTNCFVIGCSPDSGNSGVI